MVASTGRWPTYSKGTLVVPEFSSAFRERACLGVGCRRRFLWTNVTLGFWDCLRRQIVDMGAEGRLSRGWGGEGLGASSWVRSRGRRHLRNSWFRRWYRRADSLQGTVELRSRAWLLIRPGDVRVESRLARGWFVEGIEKLSELFIHFFQRLDRTMKLEEGVFVATGR